MNIRATAVLTILITCFTLACKNTDKKETQPISKDSLSCSSSSRAGSIIGRQSIDSLINKEAEGMEANN